MKKVITAIFDKCTGFMDPVVTLTQDEAIRGFRFALSNENSPIGFSPADFDLYQLGFYDTTTGHVDVPLNPVFLCNGALTLSGDKGDVHD